jgi:hypothetical protein
MYKVIATREAYQFETLLNESEEFDFKLKHVIQDKNGYLLGVMWRNDDL